MIEKPYLWRRRYVQGLPRTGDIIGSQRGFDGLSSFLVEIDMFPILWQLSYKPKENLTVDIQKIAIYYVASQTINHM
jgi:hypothetical protein